MRSKPWTAGDVCKALPMVYRMLPRTPLLASGGELALVFALSDGRRLDPGILLTAVEEAIGLSSREGRILIDWAKLRAEGGSNQDISDYRKRKGFKSASTWKRRQHDWCKATAVVLNRRLGFCDQKSTPCACLVA